MHELSIAVSLVEVAAAEAAKHAGNVVAVHVQVGRLSGVVDEALATAWQAARVGSPLERANLVIEDVPAAAYCPACASDQDVVSPQWLRCARCGAPVAEIVRGRELDLIALEVE